ncbi:MAG: hypothetical protein QOC92_794 [Acidimicrobiaceae bacterium]
MQQTDGRDTRPSFCTATRAVVLVVFAEERDRAQSSHRIEARPCHELNVGYVVVVWLPPTNASTMPIAVSKG